MPRVLAVCDVCGSLFPTYGVEVGAPGIEVIEATFTVGQDVPVPNCPVCGGTSHILSGEYNVVGDTLELLQGPERTISELERLAEILREARQRSASVEEVKEEIQRETPNLTALADLLPRTRSDLYAFIQIVLTAITLLLTQTATQNIHIQDVDIDVNQIIGITVEEQTQSPTVQSRTQQVPKVGRNELCPCGSAKKYKKCHGDPLREQR